MDSDHRTLQLDCGRLQEWFIKWQMQCNINKCKIFIIGSKVNNTTTLSVIEKLIWVLVNKDLAHMQQCITIRSKATRLLYVVLFREVLEI